MSTNKRAVHVATITRHHKGKTYVTHLLRHSYREEKLVTAMVVLRIIAPASKLTNFTSMQYETAQHGLAYMEPSHTGINVYGRGHVVAHDRITRFSDSLAIANFGSPVDDLEKHCVNIDFHNTAEIRCHTFAAFRRTRRKYSTSCPNPGTCNKLLPR